jgi:prepilin-type N-terminal cleavage/methylation domain-containing protein
MKNTRYNKGFTLVEVMLAAAILVIGLMLVAGAFPVGIKLTAVATERTIGAIVSAEASAKIKLFGNPNGPGQDPYGFDFDSPLFLSGGAIHFHEPGIFRNTLPADFADEFAYPSANPNEKKYYHWSGLVKHLGGTEIIATVFVTRVTGAGAKYPSPYNSSTVDTPKPIRFGVDQSVLPASPGGFVDELLINDYPYTTTLDETTRIGHIADGAVLAMVIPSSPEVQLFKILEVNRDSTDAGYGTIKLVDKIFSTDVNHHFWVIPTAVGSSRNPCIAVYPETITF